MDIESNSFLWPVPFGFCVFERKNKDVFGKEVWAMIGVKNILAVNFRTIYYIKHILVLSMKKKQNIITYNGNTITNIILFF